MKCNKLIEQEVTFVAVGDIMYSSEVYPFGSVEHILQKGDITFGNLECVLSKQGVPKKDKTLLSGSKEFVKNISRAGFDIVSLANNHIMDYEVEGLKETIGFLEKNNINYAGVGENLSKARLPCIVEKKGITFLVFAYADLFGDTGYAAKDSFGVNPIKLDYIIEDIIKHKDSKNIIIISLHEGIEYLDYPDPDQIIRARKLIDAGAHLVLIHHPHVLRGYEKYKHGIILYSLGNFLFSNFLQSDGKYHKLSVAERESIIAIFNFSNNGIKSFELIPVCISEDFQVKLLRNNEKKKCLERIESLSKEIKLENYYKIWRKKELKLAFSSGDLDKIVKYNRNIEFLFLFMLRIHKLKIRHFGLIFKKFGIIFSNRCCK